MPGKNCTAPLCLGGALATLLTRASFLEALKCQNAQEFLPHSTQQLLTICSFQDPFPQQA